MKRQAGFTLIELAVVVLLIGLLATMGISSLKAQLASAAISATKKKQDTIKDALVAYLAKNKRLPCPAIDEKGGLDATVRITTASPPNNCITKFGIVPYTELGLPKSAALDGWENFFTYAVSPKWTATLNFNGCPYSDVGLNKTCIAANAFNVGNPGQITVNERITSASASTFIADPAATPPTGAVVVLVSYGANGTGAYTTKGTQNAAPTPSTDENVNAIPPSSLPLGAVTVPSFFQRDYTDNASAPGGAFDDIVMWFSTSDLLNPLIKDRALQSAYGQWADQVSNIKNWVVAQIISSSNCTVPSSLSSSPYATDPWGLPVSYTRNFIALSYASSSAVTPTYTLIDTSANQTISGPLVGTLFGTYPNLQTQCP